MKEKIKGIIFQFIKFGIVGLSNTIISYGVYVLLTYIGFQYVLSNVIGFIVSVLNSFYWNNKYVFKKSNNQERNILFALIKTFIAYSTTGLFLNSIMLVLLVEKLDISKYIAPIFVLIVTIPLNFVINKYWSFRNKKKDVYNYESKEN